MKTFVLLLLILGGGVAGMAQTRKAAWMHPQHLKVQRYNTDTVGADRSLTLIGMDYGEAKMHNPEVLYGVPLEYITQIDLVYSGYPSLSGAAQDQLNLRRRDSLLSLMPVLKELPAVKWRWVRQEDCHSTQEAKELFHGFVITWSTPGGRLDPYSPVSMRERVHKAIENGKADKRIDSAAYWMMNQQQFELYVQEQTLVEKVMNRHPEWKQKLIVQDVTGSMLPYYEQVVVWHALNGAKADIQSYVFFNDGDATPDAAKVPGKTGGLYYVADQDIDHVMDTLFTATLAGGGGDLPENNIEAVLGGLEKYPNTGEIVMVADNWATPRDLSLLKKVKRPVRVVLCGAWMGVNAEYLNLARETGGSVHTAEADLDKLFELKEGEVIKLRDQAFKVEGGAFVPFISM